MSFRKQRLETQVIKTSISASFLPLYPTAQYFVLLYLITLPSDDSMKNKAVWFQITWNSLSHFQSFLFQSIHKIYTSNSQGNPIYLLICLRLSLKFLLRVKISKLIFYTKMLLRPENKILSFSCSGFLVTSKYLPRFLKCTRKIGKTYYSLFTKSQLCPCLWIFIFIHSNSGAVRHKLHFSTKHYKNMANSEFSKNLWPNTFTSCSKL